MRANPAWPRASVAAAILLVLATSLARIGAAGSQVPEIAGSTLVAVPSARPTADSSARVVVDGVWLSPPYVFEIVDRALLINGRIAVPARPLPPPTVEEPRHRRWPSDPQGRLIEGAFTVYRDSRAPTREEKLAEVVAFLRASLLVKSALLWPGSGHVDVVWEYDDHPISLGFGPELPRRDPAQVDSVWLAGRRREWVDLVDSLGLGLVVENGRECAFHLPGLQRVRTEMEALERGDSLYAPRLILARMREAILARRERERTLFDADSAAAVKAAQERAARKP